MTKHTVITGSGGGKSASAGEAYYRQPDTIRSTATARMLAALSAGPIKGLKNGIASIRFDGVPLSASSTGGSEFGLIEWQATTGTADQKPTSLKGFNAVETTQSVAATIARGRPWSRSGKGDAARITLRFPRGLVRQNDAGIFGASVRLAIDRRQGTGAWQRVMTPVIAEKQTALFEMQFLVPLTGDDENLRHSIRISRLTENSTDSNVRDEVQWLAITWLKWDRLAYPGLSTLALRIGADSFSGRLPRLSVDVEGRLVRVPVNYNPSSRSYAGIWTGRFKLAFSNNPAWVLFDLLTDSDWGLGIAESLIEIYDLYAIARYADEEVADGSGGMEARFLFDGVIARRVSASQLISQICAAIRVSYFWSGGRLRFIQDSPQEPVLWLTNHLVEGGSFIYSGPSGEAAYSHALVSFTDASSDGGVAVEAESNPDILARFGYRAREVALLGCTRRSQARRHARWLLETSALALGGVSWQASLDHLAENPIRPGDVVRIYDNTRLTDSDLAGRIASVKTGVKPSLTTMLDSAATSGWLSFESTNSGWQTGVGVSISTITQKGENYLQLTPRAGAWPAVPAQGGALVLHLSQNMQGKGEEYRIIAIRERDSHRFEISAIRYDAGLYHRVEHGLDLELPAASSAAPSGALPRGANLVFSQPRALPDSNSGRDIYASWTAPQDSRIARWRLDGVGPDGERARVEIHRPPAVLPNLAVGAWAFRLLPIDWSGREGSAISASFSVAAAPPSPRGSVIASATVSTPQWSDDFANKAIANIAGVAPVAGDIISLTTINGWAETRQFDGDNWVISNNLLSGAVLAADTVPASRLKIDDTTLGRDDADDALQLKSVPADLITSGVLQSSNYRPDATGFRINTNGEAEFNNAKIRGELASTRITGSLLVAATSTIPTQSGGRFLTLDTPRPLRYRVRTRVGNDSLRIGPFEVDRDSASRRLGDAFSKIIANNDPHGNDGKYNNYYTRFWSRTPKFSLGFRFERSGNFWGQYITAGRIRIQIKTENGRELADSGIITLTGTSPWNIGDRDASRLFVLRLSKGFSAGSYVTITREAHHSGSRSYTRLLTVKATMGTRFSHSSGSTVNDGLMVECLLDFGGGNANLTQTIRNAFYHNISLEGTTHD